MDDPTWKLEANQYGICSWVAHQTSILSSLSRTLSFPNPIEEQEELKEEDEDFKIFIQFLWIHHL